MKHIIKIIPSTGSIFFQGYMFEREIFSVLLFPFFKNNARITQKRIENSQTQKNNSWSTESS